MIQPYNRSQWERVYQAFIEYLSIHKAHSKQLRTIASEQLASIQDAVSKDAIEFKQLNPHFMGRAYTNTRIRLMNPDNRQINVLDLSHHVSGTPISWRHGQPKTIRLAEAEARLAA